jgi:hypothetical protein
MGQGGGDAITIRDEARRNRDREMRRDAWL